MREPIRDKYRQIFYICTTMKKCFLSVFLFLGLIPLNAQISNSIYKVQGLSTNVDIDISFYPNGVYLMEYWETSVDDLPGCAILSYGHYQELDNVVNLFDYLHDFTMVFDKKEGNSLIARNSFRFIMNKSASCFIAGYTTPIKTWKTPKTSADSIRKEIEEWEQSFSKQKKQDVREGEYYGSILDKNDYVVSILNDSTFKVKMYGKLLIEGTWSLRKNVILLYDPLLKATFYLLIDGDSLIGKSLPGQYNDIVLKMNTVPSLQKQKRKRLSFFRSVGLKKS